MAHEENAIVNNQGGVSETPSNLVNENVDNIVSKEELDEILKYNGSSQGESKLAVNPAGFGFVSQELVDYLPPTINGKPNTLYIVKVKNDGVVIGYRLFKFVPFKDEVDAHYERFGATPDLKLEDGPRQQKAHENNAPKEAPEKVYNGEVVFNQAPTIKGRKIEDPILRFVVSNIKAIPDEIINQLKCGDVVVKETIQDGVALYHTYIVSHRQATGICLTYTAAGYIETQSYDLTDGHWVYNSEDKWTE